MPGALAFIFFLLTVAFFAAIIIGLFKPERMIRWGETKTRGRVLAIYAPLSVISFILFAVFLLNTPTSEEASTYEAKVVTNKVEEKNNAAEKDVNVKEEKVEEQVVVETPKQQMIKKIQSLIDSKQAFDTGSYIKGDIPVGEYAFVSFEGSGKYYSEKDSSGNIIDNENFDSFGYVYVHGTGNIETRGVLISVGSLGALGVSGAKEIYQILNDVENYKDAGYYKVGLDIQPGRYILESYGEGYVAVMAGPIGKSDIVDNDIFNGRYEVNVKNGQYLKVSRATISQ